MLSSVVQASTDPAESAPIFVPSFATLADRYDLVFCDIWGVVHDGVTAYRPAGDALQRYRARGGRVVLVSNAPRPGRVVTAQLDDLGVPRDAYDDVVTSGDLTRTLITERLNQAMFYLGPDRDLSLLAGLDGHRAPLEEADYVVCTGLVEDTVETVADYGPILDRMRARGLVMICANPDIVVDRGGELVPCAGALAAAYEEIGGETVTAGKPHRPIYEEAFRRGTGHAGRPVERSRILGIGDAIRTDVAGARGFGVDSLMVGRGIHAAAMSLEGPEPDIAAARAWVEQQVVRPTYLTVELSW